VTLERRLLDLLAGEFRRFAEVECGDSPLYRRLASAVAEDPELLELAADTAESQPAPNLLFAAVHFLLLEGTEHPLAEFYPTVVGDAVRPGDPAQALRAFCRAQRPALRALLASRRVQTNEVGRAGVLLPGLTWTARQARGRPLALVEVGASAGLLLLWDRYRYLYEGAGTLGPADSTVIIGCEARSGRIPLPKRMPEAASRLGIDTHPIDPRDHRETLWLRGLVWGDEPARMRRLVAALALAASDPPSLLKGDANEILPEILRRTPPDLVPCIFHSHTMNQFSLEAREQFLQVLAAGSENRELYRLSFENTRTAHILTASRFRNGRLTGEWHLADCQAHGRWIEWL
jgi:hypothetical protein